jgi:hypothetical protein
MEITNLNKVHFTYSLLIFILIYNMVMAQNTELIIDDVFSSKPFGLLVTEQSLKSIIKSPSTQTINLIKKQKSVKSDTLIEYRSRGNKFYFLKTQNNSVFYGARITDKTIKLSRDIIVGMTKAGFLKIFKRSMLKSDTIVVSDTNEMCYHNFYFKHNRLIEINIDSCLDE